MSEFSASLYWSLPGPSGFIRKITEGAHQKRAIIISLPLRAPRGTWRAVFEGLKHANIYDPIHLKILSGQDIASEIGAHFNGKLMTASVLAHARHGSPHAVILEAEGRSAQEACEAYATEFITASEGSSGDIRLILGIHDGSHQEDAALRTIKIIAFDGGLEPDEMEAYVSLRMVGKPGPGSTHLNRHLITEYAGFDVGLAERLIDLDASKLMNLPEELGPLMHEEILRWSADSWSEGTSSMASPSRHPLREWYLATHPGALQNHYRAESQKRFWRACVKSLLPWVEQRRLQIISKLARQLKYVESQHAIKYKLSSGKIQKKIGENYIEVTREELEYNDLAFLTRDQFTTLTPDEAVLVDICRTTKYVRDKIAHIKKPDTTDVEAMISKMEKVIN